ncbi:MAG: hypothetical protein JWN41_1061 [Thermoleophilia bacterium]|nr:hypothetical protein [Thermoleophilia bacterium]
MHGTLCVLVLWSCAFIVGGCGESPAPTHAEYGRELRAATAQLDSQTQALGAARAHSSPAADVARIRTVQARLRATARSLKVVEPSPDLRREHAALVSAVRDMAAAVDTLIEAEQLASTNPARAQVLLRAFASDDSLPRVQAAAAKITRAGVDAGL